MPVATHISLLAASPDVMLWLAQNLMPLVFVFAFGVCVGSLTNVLVYRLPLGLSVVTPPSRCSACGNRLTWRENIPIFGWLFLRGKCRFCKSPISPEYPLVELFVALTFAGLCYLFYIAPDAPAAWGNAPSGQGGGGWLDVHWGAIKPEWARGYGVVGATWPLFVVIIAMTGALIAMTLTDLKTFTIPMALSLTPVVVGAIVHPLWAVYIQSTIGKLPRTAAGWDWSIPTYADWRVILAALGGVLGIGVSLLLLRLGVIKRSFDDFEAWEKEQTSTGATASVTTGAPANTTPSPTQPMPAHGVPINSTMWRDLILSVALSIVGVAIGAMIAKSMNQVPAWRGGLIGLASGIVVAAATARILDRKNGVKAEEVNQAESWTQYPHARREMVRELAFLAPCGVLAYAGYFLGEKLSTTTNSMVPIVPPLWASVLGGVLLGYLVGGGVVWAVRILGSLGFGKEAMGLGDVHLMAGVGVCVGWINATLAFFLAAVVGLVWTILGIVRHGTARRAMPYGPYLAVAVMFVVLARPLMERLLSVVLPTYAPIYLP